MEQMIEIYCKNTDSKLLVQSGMDLSEVARFAGMTNMESILGACVNNKVQNLNYRIYSPKRIEFLDIYSTMGRRIYALSLMFVLYKAVKETFPQHELIIKHSMSDGYYFEIEPLQEDSQQVAKRIEKRMREIVEENIPFSRVITPAEQAAELFDRLGMTEKAELIRSSNKLYTNVEYLGEIVNAFFFELVPSTSYLKVFGLYVFDKGFILQMPSKEDATKTPVEDRNPKKIFDIFQEHKNWVNILGTPYVSDLNKVVKMNRQNELIQVSEALHEKKYAEIADDIYRKKDKVKIVFLAGPSSSGKTTSCRRIATQLSVLGFKPLQISLDDYFVDRQLTPKDANGEYDFECLEALDLDYFNFQMKELLEGREIELPRFDFLQGCRTQSGKRIRMQESSILIVEGIHALNPKLSGKIAGENKYNIFVSALTQLAIDRHNIISSSDNRLIRRIVRDNNYRGYSAQETIMRWDSVRSGEEKHIFPFQENADSIFNSSLLYEIGVLKPIAEPLLMEVAQNSCAYADARRLINFLGNFKSIKSDYIPPTSILREFLGGSSFIY
ncbi:MAG TPA: nucleoside kinase [Candidatus Onthomorpha intestinigallinarum]|uniref:Nucleoside kinase n=1 Tax=Candidatus Onthomorpha intestinigallinarum TaxID=2840880 RepID=A0A9D1UGW2_9BACT|nr:nucleoside kinase [Candidatus Onthomorpha intestinigallinarum]